MAAEERFIDRMHEALDAMDGAASVMRSTARKLAAVGMDKLADPLEFAADMLMERTHVMQVAYSDDLRKQVQHNEHVAFGLLAVACKGLIPLGESTGSQP